MWNKLKFFQVDVVGRGGRRVGSKYFCFLCRTLRKIRFLIRTLSIVSLLSCLCPCSWYPWVEGPSSQWADIDFWTVISPGYWLPHTRTFNRKGDCVKIGAYHLEGGSFSLCPCVCAVGVQAAQTWFNIMVLRLTSPEKQTHCL